MRRTAIVYALIIVGTLAAIEAGAWLVLSLHARSVSATNEAMLPTAAPSPETTSYTSPDVRRDLDRAKLAGYRFEPYLIYLPRAFRSTHVNIDERGFRLNGTRYLAEIDYKVWVFGSSALYSVSSADNETIPAYIEQNLSRALQRKSIQVRNFGVVGFNSLQDFIHLQFRLLGERPDVVIVFNGVNDHYNAWLAPTIEDAMLHTNVMPRETLKYYADFHERGGRINWRGVRSDVLSIFDNTVELLTKGGKWLRLRAANKDIAAWKADYRNRAQADLTRARKVVPAMQRAYFENLRAIVHLARSRGAKVILVHQPLLFATKKPLVGAEPAENLHPRLSFFAMSAEELAKLREVPSYRIDQTAYWSFDYFLESYRAQAEGVQTLARELSVGFVDAQAVVDAAGRKAVFTSPYHFTFRGAQMLAVPMAAEVEAQLIGPR